MFAINLLWKSTNSNLGLIFCFSFVPLTVSHSSLLTRSGREVGLNLLGGVLSWVFLSSAWSGVPWGLLTCFCSVNQSSKKDQFVSGSYHPTIWKIFHVKSRLLSPVAIVREPHWLKTVWNIKYWVEGRGGNSDFYTDRHKSKSKSVSE